VNGKTTVDFVDDKNTYKKGHFALQQHNPGTVVKFRKIAIKELPPPKPDDEGFVPLFNRKDLTGWTTHPKQRGNWHVEKGVLIGSGPAVSHLYSTRSDYQNFHLHVEVRINNGGNSGVSGRTLFGPAFPAKNPAWPLGYEAQIWNSKAGDPGQTGTLLAGPGIPVRIVRESPVRSGEWFTLEMIAKGPNIIITVNGKTTADYTEEKRLFTRGHIALQQLDAQTVVEFRKIEIKELK
jgi:hypothetical protein